MRLVHGNCRVCGRLTPLMNDTLCNICKWDAQKLKSLRPFDMIGMHPLDKDYIMKIKKYG